MGFNLVYRSLQEVFPQVDYRILKAVAIEHSDNVDLAVEFILSDVLQAMNKSQEEADFSPGSREVGHPSSEAVESEKLDLSLDHSVPPTHAHVDPPSELRCPDGEAGSNLNADAGNLEFQISSVSCARGGFCEDELCRKTGNKEIVSLEKCQDPGSYKDVAASSLTDEHLVSAAGHNLRGQTVGDGKDPDASFPQVVLLESSIEESLSPAIQQIQSPVEEAITSPAGCSPMGEIHAGVVFDNCEESKFKAWKDDMEESIFDAEMVQIGSESLSTSHSGKMISVDLLEEFLNEAKACKKNLSSEMELLMNMVRGVELQEKAANEAKVEASKVGLDIFAKVDKLKEMLLHAKQANDMHAGVVYGEKSILATEVREFHSRLLSLSDKRDRSLSIINEIREHLSTRLAEREALKMIAEQEKLQKEESAGNALIEQEVLMDMMVQESKKIQQEAEENAKLRDFLVDRGRVVDTLQGEIAVISEDVRMLKEKVDSRLPISKGLSMSQVRGDLTSSYTSRKSMSSDRTPELSKLSDSIGKTSRELLNSEHSVESNGSKIDRDGGIRRTSTEEEWDLFGECKLSQWDVVSGDGISACGA